MRRDQMRVDPETQDSQSFLEVVLPHGRVPFTRSTFEHFRPPDVVHQYVDVPMRPANVAGQLFDLDGTQVIDPHRDAAAAKAGDQFSRVFQSLRAVVVRARGTLRPGAAPGADDRRASLAQGGCDPAPCAARRAGDNSDAATKRFWIR